MRGDDRFAVFPPVYVAYRRLDAAPVDRLINALEALLGPPPSGHQSWFFTDRRSIKCGSSWYYNINDAHRSASSILAVLSSKTLPKAADEYDMQAIFMDEIFLGQASGRLLPVRIDGMTEPLHVLGLNQSQCVPWTGLEEETLNHLANRILESCVVTTGAVDGLDAGPKVDPLREAWIERCRDAGLVDTRVAFSPGVDVIVRPVPSLFDTSIVAITKHPIGRTSNPIDVRALVSAARKDGYRVRLPFSEEVERLLDAPLGASSKWRHPLDLGVDQAGGAVWALDLDDPTTPVAIERSGLGMDVAETTPEIWLIVDDWA